MKLPRVLAPRRIPASHGARWITAAVIVCGAAAQATSPANAQAAASAVSSTAAQAVVDQLPPSATLRKIVENGAIVLGVRESSMPFSYFDRQQQPIGYSHDIALKIVDEIKRRLKLPDLTVKTVLVTSANRISFVVNNQVDLECGSTTHITERDPLVAFSNSFFQYGVRMVVKRKSGIKDYDDLAGKTVSTTAGTSDERILRQMSLDRKLDLRIISARDHAEAFQAVKTDRAVAFVMDDPLLYGKIAQEGAARRRLRGDRHPARVRNLRLHDAQGRSGVQAARRRRDRQHAALRRSAKLYETWFMQPIPPDGINLQFPMSPEMKALFANPNDHTVDLIQRLVQFRER